MSTFLFVDILAYSGAGIGVLALFYVGMLLMRPTSAVRGLAAFIGEDKAREYLDDGSFKPGQARAVGTLFLCLASFVSFCIVRGVWH